MTRNTTARPGLAALLSIVAALAVAACSSGGVDAKADQKKADAAVIQASDLSGYSSDSSSSATDASDSSKSEAANKCFAEATGQDPNAVDKDQTAKAESSWASGKDLSLKSLQAEVQLVKDAKVLTESRKAFSNSAVKDCLKSAFAAEAATGEATLTDLDVAYKELDGIGDGGGTFTLTGNVEASSIKVPFTAEINYVQVGRAALTVTVTSLSRSADHDLAVRSLQTMADRVK